MRVDEHLLMLWRLDELEVRVQEVGEEESEVVNELLLVVVRGRVCRGEICVSR